MLKRGTNLENTVYTGRFFFFNRFFYLGKEIYKRWQKLWIFPYLEGMPLFYFSFNFDANFFFLSYFFSLNWLKKRALGIIPSISFRFWVKLHCNKTCMGGSPSQLSVVVSLLAMSWQNLRYIPISYHV
jgi:hypothetical protein